jgi:hypothetical protein
MDHEASVHHETKEGTGYVTLLFEGVSVSGGRRAKMNPPGKAHPAEPPEVTFDDAHIVDDELDRDLDAVEVFEQHDTDFCDQLLESESEAHDPSNRNLPGDYREAF